MFPSSFASNCPLSQHQGGASNHSEAQRSANGPQPTAGVSPLHRGRVDVVDRVQRAHDEPRSRKEGGAQISAGISLRQQASENRRDEDGEVLKRVAVAGLAALVGSEVFGAESLLDLLKQC